MVYRKPYKTKVGFGHSSFVWVSSKKLMAIRSKVISSNFQEYGNVIEFAKKALENEGNSVLAAAARLGDEIIEAVDLIITSHGRCIVCGMGKSGLVARKISATLSSTGTPSFFLHPAEALHGDLGMVTEKDVILLLSHSGETDEIVRLIPFIRRIGAQIIAITGCPNSSLGKLADVVLNSAVEREACPMNLAPTSSTTVALALGDALAVSLLHVRGFQEKDFASLHPSGSLGKKFVKVRDLMHTDTQVPLIPPNITLKESITRISHGRLGVVVIVDESQGLLGILTDGDLRRYFEQSDGSASILVSEVMTKDPKVISPDRLVVEALKIMEQLSITSLPVLEEKKVVGVIHLHDILKSRIV